MKDKKRDETPEAIRAAAKKAALETAGLAAEKALDEALKQAGEALNASFNRARSSILQNLTVTDDALDEALELAHASRRAGPLDDALELAHASRRAALAAEHDDGQIEELIGELEQTCQDALAAADASTMDLTSKMQSALEAARKAADAAREALLSAPSMTEWEEVNAEESSVWGQLEPVAAALEYAFKATLLGADAAKKCRKAARDRAARAGQEKAAQAAPEAYRSAAREALANASYKARQRSGYTLLKVWRMKKAARKAASISAEAAWRLRLTDKAETARAVYALAEASVSLAYETLKTAYAARNDAAIAAEYLTLWTVIRETLALCRANENENDNETPQTHFHEQPT